jgi:hypothetical protein
MTTGINGQKTCISRTDEKYDATWHHWAGKGKGRCFVSMCLQMTHSLNMHKVVHSYSWVDCIWNVMAHAQKPDFVFRQKGRVHLNRLGRQSSRPLAAEVCASAVVMLDTPCSEVVWEYWLPTPFMFPLHFPSRESSCAITFQLESNTILSVSNAFQHFIRRGHHSCFLRFSYCDF